jgi:hypothetical protein
LAAIDIRPAVSLAFAKGIGIVKDSIALNNQLTFRGLNAVADTSRRGTRTSWHGFHSVALVTNQSSLTIPVTLALPLAFSEKILVGRQPKILQGWYNIRGIVAVVRHESKWTNNTTGNWFKERAFKASELARTV